MIVSLFLQRRVVRAHLNFDKHNGQRSSLRRWLSQRNDCHSPVSVRWRFDILEKRSTLESWCFSLYRTTLSSEVPFSLQSIVNPWLLIKVSEESVHALHRCCSRQSISAAVFFLDSTVFLRNTWLWYANIKKMPQRKLFSFFYMLKTFIGK
jgi:hypothetical protein